MLDTWTDRLGQDELSAQITKIVDDSMEVSRLVDRLLKRVELYEACLTKMARGAPNADRSGWAWSMSEYARMTLSDGRST